MSKKYNIRELVSNTDFEAQRKDKELIDFVNSLPDIFNGEPVTKDNQHGCSKCKLDKICMYCGLDLRGYTREHKDKHLTPYEVLVLGLTEPRYIPVPTKPTWIREDSVYFDIDKLNFAMSQKGIKMPNFNSFEEFEEWLDREDKGV